MTSSPAFTFLPLGAIIQEFRVAGLNIVQGFATEEQYKQNNAPHFGETIGRVANRIKDAKISLNGKSYNLAANNGPNNLHGGNKGWGTKTWYGLKPIGLRSVEGLEGEMQGGESVRFTLRSEDGDEGFPGDVDASVVYTTGTQTTEDGKEVAVLAIDYEAQLVGGADETAINMTNHSYFNLSGEPTIADTQVELSTNKYLVVDDGGIPSGEIKPYPGVEANKSFVMTQSEPDIDDCFVFDTSQNMIDTRSKPLKKLVSAYHPASKIHLEVYSTEPAFQFYTGKYIEVPAVDGLPARGKRSGFCVEPSRYVDAANNEEWRDQVVLKKGETYGSRIVYRAWSDEN
jgi:aldose 1-epimerase